MNIQENIEARLFTLQDLIYRDFQSRLIPTVEPEAMIGVRTPELRRLARELGKTPESAQFIQILPHKYYEENNLHAFLIEQIRDYKTCASALDAFLPYVDNWATCDLMSPKIFKKHLPELLEKIREWLKSNKTYTVRFAVGMLMGFYLDEQFEPEYPELVAGIKSKEYYVNMMIAWYFATALVKQYDAARPFIEQGRLEIWTHNKTIQKAVESLRISEEKKVYLKSLKR